MKMHPTRKDIFLTSLFFYPIMKRHNKIQGWIDFFFSLRGASYCAFQSEDFFYFLKAGGKQNLNKLLVSDHVEINSLIRSFIH